MKSSVYNIFDDVSEKVFPGFTEVTCQPRSFSNFKFPLVFCICSCIVCSLCRQSGWTALKSKMKLSLYPVDGIIKFIIWYLKLLFFFLFFWWCILYIVFFVLF